MTQRGGRGSGSRSGLSETSFGGDHGNHHHAQYDNSLGPEPDLMRTGAAGAPSEQPATEADWNGKVACAWVRTARAPPAHRLRTTRGTPVVQSCPLVLSSNPRRRPDGVPVVPPLW